MTFYLPTFFIELTNEKKLYFNTGVNTDILVLYRYTDIIEIPLTILK